jgi:flagellar biosynthetic protein FlhB
MAEDKDQRTEEASGKRRKEFRKKGQVAQSKEVHTAALTTSFLVLWYFYASTFYTSLSKFLGGIWRIAGTFEITRNSVWHLAVLVVGKIALLLAPVLLMVLVVGSLSSILQVGWLITTKPLEPDFTKLNPLPGMAKFISKKSLVELIKSLAKVLVVGAVAYQAVRKEFGGALHLMDMQVIETIRYLGRVAFEVLAKSSCVLIVLGVLDFIYARWEMEEQMKMTKQEKKEEHKESEGDPQLKGKIRSMQMQAARKRMMAEIPKADVVVTNPTHLSVVLSYNRGEMDAPRVVAKGADHLAMRIREVARENHVPLVENVPVARALYQVDLGGEIPEEMFKAVAEILAYVYGLKGNKR